jgi:hypothetical protein
MRASRAYIAGFGTAGSLLAGAAVAFVLASAVVAFRGWPQVADQASPASVVLAPRLEASSARSGHLHGIPAGVGRAAGARIAAVIASPTGRVASVQQASGRNASATQNRLPANLSTPSRIAGAAPVKPAAGCTVSCKVSSVTTQLAGTAESATGTLGGTVAAAGRSLGSTVTGVAGALARTLTGVSTPLANTVSRTGAALGNTVSNATGATGAVLTNTGHALGGIVRGLGH